jgi:hypothetical protein
VRRIVLLAVLALTACEDPFSAEPVRFYQSVTTGGEHTCAVAVDGSAWCWGKGMDGELGTGIKQNEYVPARVRGDIRFTEIAAGAAHTCAVAVDGAAYCWGFNGFWERGNETDPRDAEPVPVESTVRFRSITAGAHHTCALSVDSLAYCWGQNTYGQLGDGTRRTRAQPQPVSGNTRFAQLTAGAAHTCAITAAGSAYCWGRNDVAQLGTGAASPFTLQPTAVATSVRFRQIDAGTEHTCAVALNNRFYCWGGAEFGEVGTGGAVPPGSIAAAVPVPTSQQAAVSQRRGDLSRCVSHLRQRAQRQYALLGTRHLRTAGQRRDRHALPAAAGIPATDGQASRRVVPRERDRHGRQHTRVRAGRGAGLLLGHG